MDTNSSYVIPEGGVTPCGLKPGASAYNFCDKVMTEFDQEILSEEYLRDMIDRNPAEAQMDHMYRLCQSFGFNMPSCAPEFGHFEKGRITSSLKLGEKTEGGGAGQKVRFKLDPECVTNVSGHPTSYAREGFVVHINDCNRIYNAEITCVVVEDDCVIVEFMPLDKSCDLCEIMQPGCCLPVVSSAFAKGSCEPCGLTTLHSRYQNCMSIIKEALCIDGQSAMRCYKVSFLLPDGTQGSGKMIELQSEMKQRFQHQIEGALLVGTKNNNVTHGDLCKIGGGCAPGQMDGNLVQMTEGLIPFAAKNGWQIPYTPGTFSVDTFYEIDAYLQGQGAPTDYLFLHGYQVGHSIQSAIRDYAGDFVSNEYISRTMYKNCSGLTYLAAFKGFSTSGTRNFIMKSMPSWSQPNFLGTSKGVYPNYFIAMPFGLYNVPSEATNDMRQYNCEYVSLKQVPMFGYRYLANPGMGYSREMEVIHTHGTPGLMSGPATMHCDLIKISLRGQFGFHGTRGNLFVVSKVKAAA